MAAADGCWVMSRGVVSPAHAPLRPLQMGSQDGWGAGCGCGGGSGHVGLSAGGGGVRQSAAGIIDQLHENDGYVGVNKVDGLTRSRSMAVNL